MAACATRSASSAARVTEEVATGLLGLSHDELSVLFDGLADPLQPVVAVALSSTCLELQKPLQAALEVLKPQHESAVALCRKVLLRCVGLREAKRLEWRNERLTPADMATLGMLLPKCSSLTYLALYGNTIGNEGATALAAGVAASSSLAELWLGKNYIGDKGAKALAAGVAASRSLAQLGLGINQIGDEGAKALAAGVAASGSLAKLWLQANSIGDEGAKALAGVAASGSLTILNLNGNTIGHEGAMALARCVAASDSMATLVLTGNQIGAAASKSLHKAVEDRQGFELYV